VGLLEGWCGVRGDSGMVFFAFFKWDFFDVEDFWSGCWWSRVIFGIIVRWIKLDVIGVLSTDVGSI
jgi:hypothetical protein